MDPIRLALEARALQTLEGVKGHLIRRSDGLYGWDVRFQLEGNEIHVHIIYPKCYPARPPQIVSLTPLPEDAPHRLTGDGVCWMKRDAAAPEGRWDPSHDTVATCVLVAYRYFAALLVWIGTGRWPVPEAE